MFHIFFLLSVNCLNETCLTCPADMFILYNPHSKTLPSPARWNGPSPTPGYKVRPSRHVFSNLQNTLVSQHLQLTESFGVAAIATTYLYDRSTPSRFIGNLSFISGHVRCCPGSILKTCKYYMFIFWVHGFENWHFTKDFQFVIKIVVNVSCMYPHTIEIPGESKEL